MKTSVVIYRPLLMVWEYVTTPDNWERWWGGAMVSVTPAWERGAQLRWSQGEPTLLSQYLPQQQLTIQDKWMETIFQVDEAPGGGTRLEVEIRPRSGASFPDGGKAHIEDISDAIDRLKRLLEGATLPVPETVPIDEHAPDEVREGPILSGRNYVVLMVAMIGIGLVFTLIPCLVINTLFAGGLAAWLWISREGTPKKFCLRRGLLAGMLAGLGSTVLGSFFFLWDISEMRFIAILAAVSEAMALFLLPAGLAGLLTGFVLSRRAGSKSNASQSPLQFGEAFPKISHPNQSVLTRESIERAMHASAAEGLSHLSSNSKAETTKEIVAQVMSGEEFTYAVESVMENLPECLADRLPRSVVKEFPGILVSITVFPALTPVQVRSMLPDGYVNLVKELVAPFQETEAKTHVAHWSVASDGSVCNVYLTVIPNPDTERGSPTLIARELLNNQERVKLGV